MLCYHAVFSSLGYGLNVWKVGVSSIAAGSAAYVPISVQGLGTVEAAAMWIFGRLSVPPSDVLSGFLALRAGMFLLALLVFVLICLNDRNYVPLIKEGNSSGDGGCKRK
jgi:hypothetical protein